MICRLAVLTLLLVGQVGMAQAPAGAPAGTTGLCNDGTYFTGATKSGACKGHKGLKTWYGAPAAATAKTAAKTATKPASAPTQATTPPPAPAPAVTPASAPKTTETTAKTPLSAKTAAPGGGPGLVWLNTASNVYHCPGSQYYGKTKAGAYMSEADAKAKGAHPDGGKPCK
jgi:hypothetical protein